MANPTTTDNLLLAIKEVLIEGKGTSTANSDYVITSDTFTLKWWFEGRDQTGLTQNALSKPQLRVSPTFMRDANHAQKNIDESMYFVGINVHILYFVDAQLLESKQREIKSQMLSDAHKIKKALEWHQNLRQTNAGNDTGLIDMSFVELSDFTYENASLSGIMQFEAQVMLDNSN